MSRSLESKGKIIYYANQRGYIYPCCTLTHCNKELAECRVCSLNESNSRRDGNFYTTSSMSEEEIEATIDKLMDHTILLLVLED